MLHLRTHHYLLLTGAIVAAAAGTLFFMGQIPMCKCGYVKLWHGVVASSENSQHVADWYTFSHVIHGFAFYGLLWLVGRRPSARSGRRELVVRRWPLGLRLVVAMFLEASWEIFENTDFTINRYRSVTISLDYYGDSVLNSACDMLAMALGFFVAARLPVWGTLALVVALEAFVAYWIRDNLALNIIMLIYPLDAIHAWQMGGVP
ncbi:MAG: DUF2585 domain-containing protein [Vicinamibacterales bacterium]